MRPAGLDDKANCVIGFWVYSGGFLVPGAVGDNYISLRQDFRVQSKQIDNRTNVRYNNHIATLGSSYGTVQRKIGKLSTMVSLTIPFNWPLIGGEMSAGSACGLSML